MVAVFSSIFHFVLSVIAFFATCLFRLFANHGLMMIEKEVDFGVGNEESENLETSLCSSVNKYESLCLNKGTNGFVEEPKATSFTVTELYFPSDSNDSALMNIQQRAELAEEDEEFNIGMLFENDGSSFAVISDDEEEENPKEVFWDWDCENLHLESKECGFISLELTDRQREEEESNIGVDFENEKSRAVRLSSVILDNNKMADDHEEELEENPRQDLVKETKGGFISLELTSQRRVEEESNIGVDFVNDESRAMKLSSVIIDKNKIDDRERELEGNPKEDSVKESKECGFISLELTNQRRAEEDLVFENEEIKAMRSSSVILANNEIVDDHEAELEENPKQDSVKDTKGDFVSLELSNQQVEESKAMRFGGSVIPVNTEIVNDENPEDDLVKETKGGFISLELVCSEEEYSNSKDEEHKWEHDDVIEQLKWELSNAPGRRLPTIMEEEEEQETTPYSQPTTIRPIVVDDYKYKYKDRMEDVKKVYNMYAQRMKKLDIFITQTMHAIGLMRLKVSEKQKKTILSRKPHKDEYAEKLQNDLESAYVGQICLSWEMLTWQHRQVRELLNDVAEVPCQYNIVATELQVFRVLTQRFVEDESFHFQASRLHNYANTRCVFRTLMQVPLLRDDDCGSSMNKDNHFVVDLESLDGLIIEAMLAFSQFIRKDNLKISHYFSQSKLVQDVKRDFHKKERKVKDIERSWKCVVNKLQKKQKEIGSQHALFLAQLDLRLVSRVLSMSKLTTDHLIWCRQKLDQITFSNRKLRVQNSFLPFPC